jgi:hypothetical protein
MTRLIRLVLAVLTLPAAWSCGSGGEKSSAQKADARTESAASPVTTAPEPKGCELVPRAEIERIVGPLEGEPEREGTGCWYYFPFDSSAPEWARLREWERQVRASAPDTNDLAPTFKPRRPGVFVDVDLTGAALLTARGVAAAEASMGMGGSEASAKAKLPAGWDQIGAPLGRAGFTGRVGHVTVTVALQGLKLPADTVAAVAARVRDRIPDLPFKHPAADASGSPPAGQDPCSVLTRAEAEAVLGKLAVPPFRTRDGSPLADPSGKSCAYFTPGHHVLVLTPEWEYGSLTLNAERMAGNLVSQVADLPGPVADTLEGLWDDAVVGTSGDLILLKAPTSLTVGYLMSSTDAAGAIRLSATALQRLADAPKPTRPSVASDGCLPPTAVGEVITMPVRLAGNGAKYGAPCYYQLEADPTVSLELLVQPGEKADSLFAAIQSRAKVISGSGASPDRIDVGQGGWARGSNSSSEAAARANGKVYHARIQAPLSSPIPNPKDAMVRLVVRMMN